MDRKKKAETTDEPVAKKVKTSCLVSDRMNFNLDMAERNRLDLPKNQRPMKKLDLAMGKATLFEGITGDNNNLSARKTPAESGWLPNVVQNFRRKNRFPINDTDQEMFNIITDYLDLFAVTKHKSHRDIYVAHILNHLISSRNTVLGNHMALQGDTVSEELIESSRDQGFVRTSCLIMCPFKKDGYDVVQRLIGMVFGKGVKNVRHIKRFEEEFVDGGKVDNELLNDDFKELLSGNNDDCFRIGISISKKALKLYEPFDTADLILCSPLGLRMILEKERDESHYVSSLQIVVVDGVDVMLQQNWENLSIVFEKMHSLPSNILADISRVKSLYLEGNAKYYSQLLMFSQYQHELFAGLMFERSLNYRGLVLHQPRQEGMLSNIEIPLCQEFLRFNVEGADDPSLSRFNFFANKFANCLVPHTCIVIPSYFDFVRLRNYFKRHEESFVSLHEYAEKKKVKRARDMFFHELKKILLVTERFHYFHRYELKGIERLIFYQAPSHPSFYHEFINMGKLSKKRFSASLLYSKNDRLRLCNIFGTSMANSILNSEKDVQAIVSE